MANFDQNKWYQISTPGGGLSFVGSPDVLKDGKTTVQPYGAVFLRTSNSTDREQQWQIYPVNETTLVLRTRASGPSNYMGTAIDFGTVGTVNGGNTKPIMGNHTLMDSSVLWSINAWGDGLFYFENAQNGSAWHLNHTGNGYFDMSSNITAPQDEQSFTFKAVGTIDNQKFSTIDVSFLFGATRVGRIDG
ncbi:hypothetical protein GTA08_BOTSDO07495 [Neofusicoccum parvum]|uniref:Uncharacterized protein n=1 Tax=Neofusicoccum parvum TaxID=310453 RepID=A0ACB5SAY8_9PEZI|nr:hypothetical protein GTA08_BOTSDO07495 [Neofusicoccum parvum]